MEILLRDLKLERVDFFDEAKIHYIEGLLDDELIKKYLGYLKDGISIPPFIKDKRTSSEIRYAIDSLYRKSGLGSKLVNQVSDFILENTSIDSLTAIIQQQNSISQHIVENSGYLRGEEDIDGIIFEKSSFKR